MRIPLIFFVAILATAAAACTSGAPSQQASSDGCRQFALSGGYPYLRGGSISGPNSTLLELPGAPPLWPGKGNDISAHLDQQDYLERWCQSNLMPNSP